MSYAREILQYAASLISIPFCLFEHVLQASASIAANSPYTTIKILCRLLVSHWLYFQWKIVRRTSLKACESKLWPVEERVTWMTFVSLTFCQHAAPDQLQPVWTLFLLHTEQSSTVISVQFMKFQQESLLLMTTSVTQMSGVFRLKAYQRGWA